ncbi:hypothetical protein L7F22_055731 [Adiantum nelumboides]|nr:hypothetical protein [Adiantum nelumboides]
MARFSHQRSQIRRWASSISSCHRTWAFGLWLFAFISVALWQRNLIVRLASANRTTKAAFDESFRTIPALRSHVFNLTQFGAVGDGKTLNTHAFEIAVSAIAEVAPLGGGQLNVPPGVWLTGPFNLTSHMTLFLAAGSVILGTQEESYWPLMPPLPSYGRGREYPGPRYGSLLHGQHLEDVVITGHNGTIDGQGKVWWQKQKSRKLRYTRGRLIQFMWSRHLKITNITLRNSPFWTLHPYDCDDVVIEGVTILNPVDSPNTDGIDPDSCRDVLIENCYISVGDDCIAVKSGWDQYGIEYGRASSNIVIRNITAHSPVSAGVSFGSEMSGGISNVTVENLYVWHSKRGVRIKTAEGRGGYVAGLIFRNVMLDVVRVGIVIKTDYNEHPDKKYDPKALPRVHDITFVGVHGKGVRIPVRIYGSAKVPVTGLELKDLVVEVTNKKKHIFQCHYVHGKVIGKSYPRPCDSLDVYDENGTLIHRASSANITQN